RRSRGGTGPADPRAMPPPVLLVLALALIRLAPYAHRRLRGRRRAHRRRTARAAGRGGRPVAAVLSGHRQSGTPGLLRAAGAAPKGGRLAVELLPGSRQGWPAAPVRAPRAGQA